MTERETPTEPLSTSVGPERPGRAKKPRDSKASATELAIQLATIAATSVMRAVAVVMFANPNKLSLGGVTGIGTILYAALGWDIGLTTFVMNAPLLVLAYFFINKRFALLTLISVLTASILMDAFSFLPAFVDDVFVASIMSGALTGIAIGALLRANCSTGGTDIVGLLAQNRFPNAKVAWLFFVLNILTGVAAGLAFKSLSIVIFSAIAILTESYATDMLQRGMLSTFEAKIITSKPEEISDYVINALHRSVSASTVTGMYSRDAKPYLICIVRRRQLASLKKYVRAIDANSFMYVTSVYDVAGRGFDDAVVPKSKLK